MAIPILNPHLCDALAETAITASDHIILTHCTAIHTLLTAKIANLLGGSMMRLPHSTSTSTSMDNPISNTNPAQQRLFNIIFNRLNANIGKAFKLSSKLASSIIGSLEKILAGNNGIARSIAAIDDDLNGLQKIEGLIDQQPSLGSLQDTVLRVVFRGFFREWDGKVLRTRTGGYGLRPDCAALFPGSHANVMTVWDEGGRWFCAGGVVGGGADNVNVTAPCADAFGTSGVSVLDDMLKGVIWQAFIMLCYFLLLRFIIAVSSPVMGPMAEIIKEETRKRVVRYVVPVFSTVKEGMRRCIVKYAYEVDDKVSDVTYRVRKELWTGAPVPAPVQADFWSSEEEESTDGNDDPTDSEDDDPTDSEDDDPTDSDEHPTDRDEHPANSQQSSTASQQFSIAESSTAESPTHSEEPLTYEAQAHSPSRNRPICQEWLDDYIKGKGFRSQHLPSCAGLVLRPKELELEPEEEEEKEEEEDDESDFEYEMV